MDLREITQIQPLLDKGLAVLQKYNLVDVKPESAGLAQILQEVAPIDTTKITAIARVIQMSGTFDELVNKNIDTVSYSDRYHDINKMFDSIVNDSKNHLEQASDNKIDWSERLTNLTEKLTRGTVHARFGKIRDKYQAVTTDTSRQLQVEKESLGAYVVFREALKNAEILSKDVIKTQEGIRTGAQDKFKKASDALEAYKGADDVEKGRLQLTRDQAQQKFNTEENRYGLVIKVSNAMTEMYSIGGAVYAKAQQISSAKEMQFNNLVITYASASNVITGLDFALNAMLGLHEATQTSKEMREGKDRAIDLLATAGTDVQLEAVKEATGPSYSLDTAKKLIDSLVDSQRKTYEIITEQRELSMRNSREITGYFDAAAHKFSQITDDYIKGRLAPSATSAVLPAA